MKIKIFLIFILFLIALPIAYAGMQGDIYDSSVLVYECDDTTTDSSTYNNDGTTSGTVVIDEIDFKTGTGSCDFDATGKTTFTNNGEYAEMINQTYFFWLKSTNTGEPFTKLNDEENPNINGEISTAVYNSPALYYKMRFKTYTSSLEQSSCDNQGLGLGHWNFITLKIKKVGAVATKYFYVNGSECYNVGIGDFGVNGDNIVISGNAVTQSAINRIDGFSAVNRSLTTAEISYMFNSGNGRVNEPPTPTTPPDEQTFTITAKDIYDDSNINNLTITISNSSNKYTYSTQNGTILVSNKTNLQISKFNVTYDIKFSSSQAGGYLNNTHNINLTDGGSFEDNIYQAILYINASEVFSGSGIDEFWALSPLQINKSNSTGWTKLLLSAGSYNISANSTGYLDNKKSIDIAALSTNYENIVFGSANLSINAISIISGNSINDFSINITEISLNKKINKSTDDGSLILSAITGAYNVTIISDNFAYDSQTINILAADTLPNITFSLYTRNSINITIYDEETLKIINDTTTTLILNNLDSIMQTLYTSNGTIYKDDLFGGLWDIAVFNDFYTRRNYFVTIVDDTHTTLNVWLLNSSNGESKTFNIRNQEDEPLEDVFMTITNKVNDTFVVVAQKYSDISGQLSIFLKSTTEYRIMLEAAGYTTKIFNLEPASSLYNIILSTDVDIPFTTIYDKVSYSLTTTEGSLNFSIITSSTGGFISFFGLNSSFDGINYLTNVTGSVGGGTASIIILNSSNSTGRTIDIDYFIKLNGEDLINLHNTYYTYNATAISNYSALSVAEKYKGDFSGVMLAVISILVVVAIVATFAELGVPAAISGFAGAIILFVFSILGWLPILMTSSILIIVIGMFLFRRGD